MLRLLEPGNKGETLSRCGRLGILDAGQAGYPADRGGHLATNIGCERIEDERGQRRRQRGSPWTETWLSWSRADDIGRRDFPSDSQRWRFLFPLLLRPSDHGSDRCISTARGKTLRVAVKSDLSLLLIRAKPRIHSTVTTRPGVGKPVEIGQHEVKFHVLGQ